MIKEVYRITDACSSRPVLHRFGDIPHSVINITLFQLPSDACETCAKDKRFDVHQSIRDCVNKMQQEPRVEAHGAANVTDDDEWTWFILGLAPCQFKQFCSVFEVTTHNTAHIRVR